MIDGIQSKRAQSINLSDGSSTSISKGYLNLNPLKKKEREPEWEHLTHFVGHRDGIWEVSSCKWEKYLFATASADCTARIWSSDAQSPVYIYTAHKGSVNSIRFHATNRLACTASGDNSVHVWKIPKPNEKEKSKEDKTDHSNKPWSPLLDKAEKSNTFQSIGENRLNNIETPSSSGVLEENSIPTDNANFGVVMITRSIFELKHKGPVIAADWNGDRIISGSWDNTVKVCSIENGRCLVELDAGHESSHYLTNVSTHHSGPFALTSSSDGYFRIWDIRSSQPKISSVQAHTDIVTTACFSFADENIIVTGGDDRSVKIWDRRNMTTPRNSIRCSAGVNRLSISTINSWLAVPLDDSRTKVCDVNGKELGRLKSESKRRQRLMMTSATWSSDETVIFTTGFDKLVVAWGKPKRL